MVCGPNWGLVRLTRSNTVYWNPISQLKVSFHSLIDCRQEYPLVSDAGNIFDPCNQHCLLRSCASILLSQEQPWWGSLLFRKWHFLSFPTSSLVPEFMTILFAVPACPLWGKEFQPSHHLAYRSFCYLDSLEIHLVSRVITVGARADQANLMEFTYPLFDQCRTCTSSSCLYGFGCASWSRGLLPLVTSSEGRLSPETIHNGQNLGSAPVVNSLIHLTFLDQSNCHVGLMKEKIKILLKKANS